jgi:hypothetical protein
LGEVANNFYRDGSTHELASFFDALQTYAPSDSALSDDSIEAILRLDFVAPAPGYESIFDAIKAADFDAMQCVVTGATLISCVDERWDFDLGAASSSDGIVQFDHSSRPKHSVQVAMRWLSGVRRTLSQANFSTLRARAFPSLDWGQDVDAQIGQFSPEYIGLAFTKLASLDDAVRRWRDTKSALLEVAPIEIKRESPLTMQNYGNDRVFRSAAGSTKTYEEHFWIDRGNRVHVIVDRQARAVEIGYVGKHLKTWSG